MISEIVKSHRDANVYSDFRRNWNSFDKVMNFGLALLARGIDNRYENK